MVNTVRIGHIIHISVFLCCSAVVGLCKSCGLPSLEAAINSVYLNLKPKRLSLCLLFGLKWWI